VAYIRPRVLTAVNVAVGLPGCNAVWNDVSVVCIAFNLHCGGDRAYVPDHPQLTVE
jgi:hypothetical protein